MYKASNAIHGAAMYEAEKEITGIGKPHYAPYDLAMKTKEQFNTDPNKYMILGILRYLDDLAGD